MRRTRTLLAALAAVVAFTLLAVRAEARRATVSAEGHAVIVGGNRAMARAQAINGALRAAVGQVAGSLGAPGDGDDSATDHAVYDRAAAFVPRSTVVSEDVDGNILQVQISADVDVDALKAAVGDAARRGGGARDASAAARARSSTASACSMLATEQLGPHRVFGWTDVVWTPGVHAHEDDGGARGQRDGRHRGDRRRGVRRRRLPRRRSAGAARQACAEAGVRDARPVGGRGAADRARSRTPTTWSSPRGRRSSRITRTLAGAGMQSGQGNVVARLVRVRDGKVVGSTTQHAAEVHIDADTARLNAINRRRASRPRR